MQTGTLPKMTDTESRAFIADQAQKVCEAVAKRLGTTCVPFVVDEVTRMGIETWELGGNARDIYTAVILKAESMLTRHQHCKTVVDRLLDKVSSLNDGAMLASHQAL